MIKRDYLLPALLSMATMFPGQRFNHTKPEEKPSTTETKEFRKNRVKRKLARLSRRRNRR